jgi:hypothetical protein
VRLFQTTATVVRVIFGLGFAMTLMFVPAAVGAEKDIPGGIMIAIFFASFFGGGFASLWVYLKLEPSLVRRRPLDGPSAVLQVDDELWVSDTAGPKMVVLGADGEAGKFGGAYVSAGEGYLGTVPLKCPLGMAADGNGTVYLADGVGNCVRRLRGGRHEVLPPMSSLYSWTADSDGFEDEIDPPMLFPVDVAVLDGRVYVAEAGNDRILEMDEDGGLGVFAGIGRRGFAGDGGPATEAQFASPRGLAFDRAGALYVADRFNHAIRRIDPDGTIETVAGTGAAGFAGDGGPARLAQLCRPSAVAVAADQSLLVADEGNGRVRRVDPSGAIETLAGNGGQASRVVGGRATEVPLGPVGLGVGAGGEVLVVDGDAAVVRRIGADGQIEIVRWDLYPEARSRKEVIGGELVATLLPLAAAAVVVSIGLVV